MSETNKKQVIIYYSLTGSVKKVVSEISKLISIDIIELKPQKPYSKISAFTKGIFQNFFGNKPKIKNNIDISVYDRIFLATPVWASSFVPLFNTVLNICDFKGKEIVLISCCGGNNGKTFDNFKKKLKGAKIIGEITFIKPNSKSDLSEAVKYFISSLD